MPRGKEFRGGQYGNTRGKERQRRKRDSRAQQKRNADAAEETARHQAELDELIEQQRLNPVMGAAEGARIKAEIERRHKDNMERIEREAEQAEAQEAMAEDLSDGVVKETLPLRKKIDRRKLRKESEPKFQFATTTARMMMKAGYNIQYVMEFTGVGYDELKEFPIDDEGYAIVPDEEDEDE